MTTGTRAVAPGPARAPARTVHAVLPSGVDDPRSPSGGNVYDRRVCAALAATGRGVTELVVTGDWPDPDAAARQRLVAALAGVPDGADVLLDGLVACGVPDVVVPEAARLRTVVLVHLPLGDEHGPDPAVRESRRARERETLHAAAAVVVTSPWSARRVTALHDLPPGRVHVAVPGVDPAPLAPARPDGGRLLALGALTRTKGHDLLVDALAGVTDLPWSARVVGAERDPAHAATVRSLVVRHRITDRVQLAGAVTGAALEAVWADTDLLVLPSRSEAYGMVAAEALARGIPVLAASTGGVPETLGRASGGAVPGLLVPPDDAGALARALRRWLTDPALREGARRAARARRARLHGWEVTARCLNRVLT